MAPDYIDFPQFGTPATIRVPLPPIDTGTLRALDTTVPGGRYEGTDGRLHDANGKLLEAGRVTQQCIEVAAFPSRRSTVASPAWTAAPSHSLTTRIVGVTLFGLGIGFVLTFFVGLLVTAIGATR